MEGTSKLGSGPALDHTRYLTLPSFIDPAAFFYSDIPMFD